MVRVLAEEKSWWGRLADDHVVLFSRPPMGEQPDEIGRVSLNRATFLPPVVPSKIFCVGRNYSDHVREMNYVPTDAPSVFLKPPTTVLAPGGNVVLPSPSLSTHVEHEAELAIVIGERARNVSESEALSYVLGITGANDVSARDLQRSDPQLTRGKGFDTFCPIGPWVETEFDLQRGHQITSWVNGELRQQGNTNQMTYSVPFLISFLSQFATLLPGDVILTGSPGGSGPLEEGDQYEQMVEGVGVLQHGVVAADGLEKEQRHG